MNREFLLKRITCILIVASFIVPVNVLTAEDFEEGRQGSTAVFYTWREAESWDRSYENDSGEEWLIKNSPQYASNGQYTRINISNNLDDYIEWDFTVFNSGTYYFYIRGWVNSTSCNKVELYWNGEYIGTKNYGAGTNAFLWRNFSSLYLSTGTGTLRLLTNNTEYEKGNLELDNILITNDPSMKPAYDAKGFEGSTSHFLGYKPTTGETVGLDWYYIRNITENLSNVINDVDWDGGMEKGRAFGTKGEHRAMKIIKNEMINLSLFKSSSLDYEEKIEPISNYKLYETFSPTINLTDKLEINSFDITIHDLDEETYTIVTEACVRPSWNWRVVQTPGPILERLLSLWLSNSLLFDLSEDYVNNMIYDSSWLNKTYQLENVKLFARPTDITWYSDFICPKFDDIMNNDSICNYSSFMHYLMPAFQENYSFYFGTLNESNASEALPWFGQWEPMLPNRSIYEGDFFYIGEDPEFNPEKIDKYPWLNAIYSCVKEWMDTNPWWNFSIISEILGFIFKGRKQIEMLLWNLTMPNCKGLILYDFNYEYSGTDTYDMNHRTFHALPTIYINGSTGLEINGNEEDFEVNFSMTQNWNTSVESYNVIGQIYGSDPSQTVIVDCLYDSWWNQGTADSAIGMAMVLAIAKYYKDNNIVPKHNIKFVAFGGEEYGLRGAWYYEKTHRDENIITVIDLNQLGFDQTFPRLCLNVISSSEELNATVSEITSRTDYVNRTGNLTDFRCIDNLTGWMPASDYTPFYEANKEGERTCDTICFVKDKGTNNSSRWVLHHRDGQNHAEGDSMKYFDLNGTDINATAEMILNVTKYFAGESIFLYKGWNMVKIPVETDWWASTLTENITDSVLISWFDGINQTYKTHIVGAPIYDFPIPEDYHGLFIYVNQSTVLSWSGSPISNVNYTFGPGWNLTGWCYDYDTYASDLAENITDCDMVSWFDAINQTYKTHIVGAPIYDFVITKGMGLFVHVNDDRDGGENDLGVPYPIYGRAFFKNQSNPVYNANLTIININTSGRFDTTIPANSSGYYNEDLGQLDQSGWDNGDIIRIFVNGTGNYSGWTGQKDIVLNDDVPGENVSDIYLYPSNITLQTGWNLITIPVENDWNASDVAANITGCQSINKWDGINQSYRGYIVGIPAFDFPIEEGAGYFIEVNQSGNLSFSGNTISNVNYSFGPGWNLTGWCYDYTTNASSFAENISDCSSVNKWDAVNQSYRGYIVGIPAFDFEISKGMGLFVEVDDGEERGEGSAPGTPHTIWGCASYKDSNIHANSANVTILNENTSEQIFTTVIASGWYREDLGNLPSGWSDGHSIKITINSTDTDIYEGWTGYKIITANDSVGNQKVQDISLSGDCEVIRDDNGTKELTVTIDNSTDEALKTLEVDPEFLEKASSAKLWIYATAEGEDLGKPSHKITVNNNSSCTILFNPIDAFGYSFGWQSFNITLDWLIAETNTFSVVDAYTDEQINDLVIGIDTENDYDRSQWKESNGSLPPAGDCEGELMMVLQFIF